jgi:hypothetical protein
MKRRRGESHLTASIQPSIVVPAEQELLKILIQYQDLLDVMKLGTPSG